MNHKILVTYATRHGSTHEIAEAIREVIGKDLVDLRKIEDVSTVTPYQAVIIGSAIERHQWLPEAVDFVKFHADALRQIPVAYFAVSVTMREDTPANRQLVKHYLDPVCQIVKPVDIGLFGGALHYDQVSLFSQLMLRLRRLPEGDFRDWKAIRDWAGHLALSA